MKSTHTGRRWRREDDGYLERSGFICDMLATEFLVSLVASSSTMLVVLFTLRFLLRFHHDLKETRRSWVAIKWEWHRGIKPAEMKTKFGRNERGRVTEDPAKVSPEEQTPLDEINTHKIHGIHRKKVKTRRRWIPGAIGWTLHTRNTDPNVGSYRHTHISAILRYGEHFFACFDTRSLGETWIFVCMKEKIRILPVKAVTKRKTRIRVNTLTGNWQKCYLYVSGQTLQRYQEVE